ncbi:CTSK [Mytilus edulis]|uniref:CTSK n=1 Tax=Mytilus edulis TaxID=6550 RepID=A0A8S3VR71_MYTED|nr:CTSK [Mytilus edulis]
MSNEKKYSPDKILRAARKTLHEWKHQSPGSMQASGGRGDNLFSFFPNKIILALVICIGVCHSTQPTQEFDDEWALYKINYQKVYNNTTEELKRRLTWDDNLKYIQEHNIAADNGTYKYCLGINHLSDFTIDEVVEQGTGVNIPSNHNTGTLLPIQNTDEIPETLDWRKYRYVTPVKNQGQCGSCWALSTTGALEGQTMAINNVLTSLSEQDLVDCSNNLFCEKNKHLAWPKTNQSITSDMMLRDAGGKPMYAVEVFASSIKALKTHLEEGLERNYLTQIQKEQMDFDCSSYLAGIPKSQLHIALESEVASVYCRCFPPEGGADIATVGSKYIVADLGGGTVDISAHETLPDQKLKQLTKASGRRTVEET